jgi:hypothetical protein
MRPMGCSPRYATGRGVGWAVVTVRCGIRVTPPRRVDRRWWEGVDRFGPAGGHVREDQPVAAARWRPERSFRAHQQRSPSPGQRASPGGQSWERAPRATTKPRARGRAETVQACHPGVRAGGRRPGAQAPRRPILRNGRRRLPPGVVWRHRSSSHYLARLEGACHPVSGCLARGGRGSRARCGQWPL